MIARAIHFLGGIHGWKRKVTPSIPIFFNIISALQDFCGRVKVAGDFTPKREKLAIEQPYKGGTEFKKHLFRVIGDLDASGEEHDCAAYIERLTNVKTWVRNTVRQPHSFWLQTSSDRFYPDFIGLLNDGRVLVVEYKGSHLATAEDAKEKRLIGDLWADRSKGQCIFVMVENREFGSIDRAVTR